METRVIVGAIIENSKGEILIGRKPKNKGVYLDAWHLPGGGIEHGEIIEDALKREIKEETGLDIFDIKPVIFSDDITERIDDGVVNKIYMIFLDFICKAKSDDFIAGDDLEILKWLPKSEIRNYKFTPPAENLFKFLGW